MAAEFFHVVVNSSITVRFLNIYIGEIVALYVLVPGMVVAKLDDV